MPKDNSKETTVSQVPLVKHGYNADQIANDFIKPQQPATPVGSDTSTNPQSSGASNESSDQGNAENSTND